MWHIGARFRHHEFRRFPDRRNRKPKVLKDERPAELVLGAMTHHKQLRAASTAVHESLVASRPMLLQACRPFLSFSGPARHQDAPRASQTLGFGQSASQMAFTDDVHRWENSHMGAFTKLVGVTTSNVARRITTAPENIGYEVTVHIVREGGNDLQLTTLGAATYLLVESTVPAARQQTTVASTANRARQNGAEWGRRW